MTSGGAASGRKGSRYEREFVNAVEQAGLGTLRCPSSGSAAARDLPDLLVGEPTEQAVGSPWPLSRTWAVEHKSGDATTLYVDAAEVAALERFAAAWGARPLLAARFTTQGTDTLHYLVPPENARRTQGDDAGNYGLPVSDVQDRAVRLVDPDNTSPRVRTA